MSSDELTRISQGECAEARATVAAIDRKTALLEQELKAERELSKREFKRVNEGLDEVKATLKDLVRLIQGQDGDGLSTRVRLLEAGQAGQTEDKKGWWKLWAALIMGACGCFGVIVQAIASVIAAASNSGASP